VYFVGGKSLKPGVTGVRRIINATGYSMKGLKSAWVNEAAFRQEVSLTILMTIIAFFLPVTILERILMVGSLFIVVIVELLNSAIEATVDRISDDQHELSGRAKDIGSAAVFVSLALVVFVWLSVIVGLL